MRHSQHIVACASQYEYESCARTTIAAFIVPLFRADFPNVGEIAGNSDIVFVSTDEFVEIPRPGMPNMVNIGGLGLGQKKIDLDEVRVTVILTSKGSRSSLGTLTWTLEGSSTSLWELSSTPHSYRHWSWRTWPSWLWPSLTTI